MGFTRNYKNVLITNMCNPYSYTGTTEWNNIPLTYDNSNPFVVKNTEGTMYKLAYGSSSGLNINDVDFSISTGYINSIDFGHLCGNQNKSSSYRPKNLVFGTCSDPETIDDYKIDTISTIQFVNNPKTMSYRYENEMLIVDYSCVIKNSTDITINELGILGYITYCSSSPGITVSGGVSTSNVSIALMLLYRKKLDTPIELKANEPQLVSFSIAVNYPTDDMLNGISTQLDEIIDGGE